MSRISSNLTKIFLIIILLVSCHKHEYWQYDNYKISKGSHSSKYSYKNLLSNKIKFSAVFDSTAIYTSILPENQWDINKLSGFSDCNSHHQTNSARFGWRWLNDELQIVTYVYNNGERLSEKLIKVVTLNKAHEYELTMTPDSYIFRIDDTEVTENRFEDCEYGHYYLLYPYFGGDETAPHDINILIKDLKFTH